MTEVPKFDKLKMATEADYVESAHKEMKIRLGFLPDELSEFKGFLITDIDKFVSNSPRWEIERSEEDNRPNKLVLDRIQTMTKTFGGDLQLYRIEFELEYGGKVGMGPDAEVELTDEEERYIRRMALSGVVKVVLPIIITNASAIIATISSGGAASPSLQASIAMSSALIGGFIEQATGNPLSPEEQERIKDKLGANKIPEITKGQKKEIAGVIGETQKNLLPKARYIIKDVNAFIYETTDDNAVEEEKIRIGKAPDVLNTEVCKTIPKTSWDYGDSIRSMDMRVKRDVGVVRITMGKIMSDNRSLTDADKTELMEVVAGSDIAHKGLTISPLGIFYYPLYKILKERKESALAEFSPEKLEQLEKTETVGALTGAGVGVVGGIASAGTEIAKSAGKEAAEEVAEEVGESAVTKAVKEGVQTGVEGGVEATTQTMGEAIMGETEQMSASSISILDKDISKSQAHGLATSVRTFLITFSMTIIVCNLIDQK